jgi:CheY-like chemotaxis protein
MPDTDGATLARSLSENPAVSSIPRVLLSSTAAPDMPDDLFHARMLKPLHPSALHQLLAKILLPAEGKTQKQSAPGDTPLPPLNILVAEDNLNNQTVLRMMLRKLGMQAKIVENGALALESAQTGEYDLIILDLQMPVMDGITAVRKLNELYADAAKRPRFIALTANAFAEDKQACLAAGFDTYLAKPVTIHQLRKALLDSV